MLTRNMMQRLTATAGTVAAALAVASCSAGTTPQGAPENTGAASAPATEQAAPEAAAATTQAGSAETQAAPAGDTAAAQPTTHITRAAHPATPREAFAAAIADPARYFPQPVAGHDGTFQYALLDIDGDTQPELFIREGGEGERPVVTLLPTGEQAANTLADGDGTLLFSSGSYPGVEEYRFGETTLTVTQYELRGGRIEQVTEPQDTIAGSPLSDVNVLQWLPTTDPSGVDALAPLDATSLVALPMTGSFRQYSLESGWRGDNFNVEITYPTVRYPELGCEGTIEPTPPDYAGQAGYIEHITTGTCDDGGTWHFLLDMNSVQAGTPAVTKARYVAPDGRYVADGTVN